MDSGGTDAILFHQRWIGGSRSGAEVRDSLQQGSRQAIEEQDHRTPLLLSRQHHRGVVSGWEWTTCGLRTHFVGLAEVRSDVWLPWPMGQTVSVMRDRLRDRARKRDPEIWSRFDCGVYRGADDGI